MFKRLARPVVLISVAVAAFAAVATASAETVVTNYRNCSPDGDTGNTICFTIHSVERDSATKSGNGRESDTGSMLIEYFDPQGNLIWSDKTRWHTNIVSKDGETQVYHDQTRVTFIEDGETCTAVMNVTYANGSVRHLGPTWEWDCR